MMNIDLSVMVKRRPDTQTYKLDLLLIKNNLPDVSEHHICQTLAEVMQKTAAFEAKHLPLFDNAIEYRKINWRELAKQNHASNKT